MDQEQKTTDDSKSIEQLEYEIRTRFKIMDGWLIHYRALENTTPTSVRMWLPILEQHVKQIQGTGRNPVLMMDLTKTDVAKNKIEVRKLLVQGILRSKIKAVAGYGLSNFLVRAIFTFVIRAGRVMPGKFFKTREEADIWLREAVSE